MTALACRRPFLPTRISGVPGGVNPPVCCGLLGVLLSAREAGPRPDVAPNKRKTLQVGGCFNPSWVNIDVGRAEDYFNLY